MGISRDEVNEIFAALFDSEQACTESLATLRRTMAKKKRKMFDSPEERAAFMERWEANTRKLEARIEKLKAEQAARQQRRSQA